MSRLPPSQLASNPNMVENLRAYLDVQQQPLWKAYPGYLKQIFTGDFGVSTSNFPAPVSDVIGKTLPYSIVLVGVAFILAFLLGTAIGMIAAWRRGGTVDNVAHAGVHVARRLPRLLHLARSPSTSSASSSAGSRSSTRTTSAPSPGFNWDFLSSAFRHAQLPILVIVLVYAGGWLLNMRNVMINTIEEDYVGMAHAKGLRDRRVMIRYAGRNAVLPPLTGFAAQFGSAVGGLIFIEFVFSYPGAGLTLQQAALGSDYPLTQALLLFFAVCVLAREPRHGHPLRHPRPAGAERLRWESRPASSPSRTATRPPTPSSARSRSPPRGGDAGCACRAGSGSC